MAGINGKRERVVSWTATENVWMNFCVFCRHLFGMKRETENERRTSSRNVTGVPSPPTRRQSMKQSKLWLCAPRRWTTQDITVPHTHKTKWIYEILSFDCLSAPDRLRGCVWVTRASRFHFSISIPHSHQCHRRRRHLVVFRLMCDGMATSRDFPRTRYPIHIHNFTFAIQGGLLLWFRQSWVDSHLCATCHS